MKEKDLFNAINDIDLKYVSAFQKDVDETAEFAEPVIVKSVKKSPMRIFGGAAACVGALGVAAAVIMVSGSGNINTLSPFSTGTESSISQTEASASDISVILTSDNAVIEENWKKLRAGNENYVADDPVEAAKKELEEFKNDECFSFELYSLDYDLDRIAHQIEFEGKEHRLEKSYGITDMEKMTIVTAQFHTYLKNAFANIDEVGNCRWYLLIQDNEGNWYIETVANESDPKVSEKNEVWVSLKEEQKDITNNDALTTLENYLNKRYGNDNSVVVDYIERTDLNLDINKIQAMDYGMVLGGGENSIKGGHGYVAAETIFHTKGDDQRNHYRREYYYLICSSEGNWYVPEEFQEETGYDTWTHEEMWERLLEDEETYYNGCSDSNPLNVAMKAMNAFIAKDGVLSAHTAGCYYHDNEADGHYIHCGYANSEEYYEAVGKYYYGLEDASRVTIVGSQFEAELDPSKFYGYSHMGGQLYVLIQDDKGIWHIATGAVNSLMD